jgi:predicted phage terminase large subunit-like protein
MTALDANLDLDLLRERSKASFYFFAKGVLGFDWLNAKIHGPVCKLLENPDIKREIFVLPRSWLKTTLCSISYPIWRAVHDPNIRILIAQNNQVNARAKLSVIREQFERNALLRALYPHVLPNKNSRWSSDSLCLTRSESFPESTFECIGVRGQATSRHYNIIIEDDTVAPDFDELGEETLAPTHDDVRKAIAWHKLALPLLTNAKTDEMLVVGTRWYEHDLITHIIESEKEYHLVSRSCREDDDGNASATGRITYPERFDEETLDQFAASLGPYFFSALMLNLPVSSENMVFKREWFHEYEVLPPRNSLVVFTTMDAATDPELSSASNLLDFSTVMTCGKDLMTGNIYVMEYFRQRCNPGDHAAALFDQVLRWKPNEVGYEDVAYQRSIEYWVKELMKTKGQYFVLKPIKNPGRKSKETRIMGLQPVAAAGAIHIRPSMTELMTEFLTFPRGRHDDLIDTMAMQTNMWRRTRSKREKRGDGSSVGFDIGMAIESIRKRKRVDSDSLIFDPARCASTILRN